MVFMTIATPSLSSEGQTIDYIKIPDLEKILANPENKLFVVNLWATWCPPCVAELPGFIKTAKDFDASKVKFVMISLDFPSQIQSELIPFLKKNNISIPISVMMDIDYNSWVTKIDADWQGDIPATLIFNNSRKIHYFHTGEITEPELRKLITRYL